MTDEMVKEPEGRTLIEVPDDLSKNLSDIRNADTTKLAYIGDAVYEVFVRMNSVEICGRHAADMNRMSVHYVKADSQAKAAKGLMARHEKPEDGSGADEGADESAIYLTDEEAALFKRARNRTNTSHPRGSTPSEYKLATGFEAVIGWLYITGKTDRLRDIVKEAMRIIDSK